MRGERRFPGAFRREQRELAAPGVGADEREPVGLIDDVHPYVGGQEVGERIAIFHPESYVVERFDSHARNVTRARVRRSIPPHVGGESGTYNPWLLAHGELDD